MIKILAIVALLTAAQILPSCKGGSSDDSSSDGQAIVIGWVEEKRHRESEIPPWMIVINSREYGVPQEFYLSVSVGDLVKLTNNGWVIVRKARP